MVTRDFAKPGLVPVAETAGNRRTHRGINLRVRGEVGSMIAELLVAMSILVLAVLPLAASFASEQREVRRCYQKAVAMEVIDGEMEVLMAGEWREYKEGRQSYSLSAASGKNLPPGKAWLTVSGKRVRLEWSPDVKRGDLKVLREADVK
jgi:hypothetical protein